MPLPLFRSAAPDHCPTSQRLRAVLAGARRICEMRCDLVRHAPEPVRANRAGSVAAIDRSLVTRQPRCHNSLRMTTLLLTHSACLEHDPGRFHPERPERLQAVLAALDDDQFRSMERREAPRAADQDLALCHPVPFIEGLMGAVPPAGRHQLDGDTAISPGSGEAALRAAGAVVAAVDAVMRGEAKNAFCAVRP